MVEKRKNIDNLFQDYLVGHQVKAPVNAWHRLQSELHPAQNRRFFYFTRLAAAAILLLIAFGAGYFFSEFNKPVQDDIAVIGSQPLPEKTGDVLNSEAEITNNVTSDPEENISKLPTSLEKNSPIKQSLSKSEPAVSIAENNLQSPAEEIIEDSGTLNNTEKSEITTQPATALSGDTEKNPASNVIQPDVTLQPELMTPEMLHRLLVGDEMAYSKTENEPDNDFTMWSVGGRISPVYSFRTVSGEGFETPEDNVEEAYFNSTEQGITTIGGGISLSYFFSDNLSLASGLYVSRIGQANTDVVAYDDPNGFGGTYKLASSAGTVTINPHQFEMVMVEQPASVKDSIPGDYVVNGTFIQNMDYLEVPFVLNYKVLDRKISVNVNGGLSPGLLVNNRSYFEIDGEKIQTGTTENLKPMIYNSLLGMSFEYSFSKNLIFSIEPTFKYSLSPINSNSGINYRPYSMSWFTGISYKL